MPPIYTRIPANPKFALCRPQGSMTVWKNDVRLGVMVAEGLSGPPCWAVTLFRQGNSARIELAATPASPTDKELAAAQACRRPVGEFIEMDVGGRWRVARCIVPKLCREKGGRGVGFTTSLPNAYSTGE